jgi:peptide/nickel transport system substrate-binding protein
MKHSLNRAEVLAKVFQGRGTVGNDNPIAPTIKFAIDPEPRHAYDPKKARELLKKAGHESIKVDLSVSDAAFAGAVDAAALWREHAREAGIDINIVREPSDGYWDNVWLKKPFCASYWSGRPTCDWMFSTTYAADANWNETHWNNPRFNELLLAGRAETDEGKRARIYAEMQELVHDDGGVVVLIFNSYVSGHVDKLAHGAIGGNWPMDGYRITERWWFA